MRFLFPKIILLSLLFVFAKKETAFTQNKFVEGEIRYLVRIESFSSNQTKNTSKGNLVISLKANNVVKELVLNSGFKNKMLVRENESVAYSLRSVGKENLAIRIDAAELKKNNCKNLKIEPLGADAQRINNYKAEKAKLICSNIKPILISYTKEWVIENENLFDYFPTFQYLPLAFEIVNEDGSALVFELESIEAKPMDNACFTIPKDYKIISK